MTTNRRTLTLGPALALLLLTSASCQEDELIDPEAITNEEEDHGPPAGATTPPGEPAPIGDSELEAAISEDMFFDEIVPAHRIDVEVDEGVVTLQGEVRTLRAEERATNIAAAMRGTRAIVDRIVVDPPERPDGVIQTDIENALLADPVADAFELGVSVQDGVATLSGVVESHEERILAREVAEDVLGVKGVNDEITVEYTMDRPDVEVARDIESRLRNDLLVDDALIDVVVNDGDAILSGTVGSLAERIRARRDAWVAGTESVDDEGLEIRFWTRNTQRREGLAIRGDDELEDALEDAFAYDPRVASFDVDVEAQAGTVTLRGFVDNAAARKAAADDAKNTPGVWNVRNLLRVRPELELTDTQIQRAVTESLSRNPFVERHDLAVVVIDGKVYLNGDVDSELEAEEAVRTARAITGVTEVDSNIDIGPEADEHVADWEIRHDLRFGLRFNPWVDPSHLTIDVEDGIATISGRVDSRMAYREAVEEAREAGARAVHANLLIEDAPEHVQAPTEASEREEEEG
jgi:osmotically-inducible protein OsmY